MVTNGTKAMVDKTAGALAPPKAVASSVLAAIVFFTATYLKRKRKKEKKKPVSLKNVFDEGNEKLLLLLNLNIFLILCVTNGKYA